jgi:CheY-like chemotaxis protein
MGYKMLLADDSITIQKVVSIIFANEDYELTVVDNGNAALEKAREILPDILLVDALMPGKTGYEVCREARQDPILKTIPLLLLVGAFEPFDEEKARDSGADDHISKPFESQHLIEKVKKLIQVGAERAGAHEQFAMPTEAASGAGTVLITDKVEPPTSPVGDFGVFTDPEASAGKESREPMTLSPEDIVEASPEDDLWGIFELEEVAEGEDIQLGEIIEEDEFQPEVIDTAEEIEPFAFGEEEEISPIMGEAPADSGPESYTEESFSFNEEPEHEGFDKYSSVRLEEITEEDSFLLSDETQAELEPELGSDYKATAFAESTLETVEEPSSKLSFVPPAPLRHFAMGTEERRSSENLSSDSKAELPRTSETGGTGTVHLSEEHLSAIIAQISKELIEKIAWEVVPDLAEVIIREEIRKIKQGY